MTKYTTIELTDLDKGQKAIVEAVIHEGEMRQSEKIVGLLERKITEAYAEDNLDKIEFLESLIVEIENL